MKKERLKEEEFQNYYDLKTAAVDDLVESLKEEPNEEQKKNEPKPPQDPYKIDRLAKIPTWIKALFIKYWAAGAICYFGFIGLGIYVNNQLDLIALVGLITGAVNDLLINNAFLYFESEKKEYHKYILLPIRSKRVWTLFINIPYGIITTFLVFQIYVFINHLIVSIKNLPANTITLGVEPLLYGLFFLIVDMFFVSIKNFIVFLVKRKQ
jgi:hypothetical protein